MKLDILSSDNVTINCITYFRAIYQIKMPVDINGYYMKYYSIHYIDSYLTNLITFLTILFKTNNNNILIYYLFLINIIKLKNLISI